MKKMIIFKTICLLMLLSLYSCSEDDSSVIQEEFLSAEVNEMAFNVIKQNGVLSAQKQLSPYGTINLLVSGKTHEGKSIEFLVLYYFGEKIYIMGNRPAQGNLIKGNWCKYSEASLSSSNDFFSTSGASNYVEITEDDGSYISGNFSFEGLNSIGNSSRFISEGKFRIKIKP